MDVAVLEEVPPDVRSTTVELTALEVVADVVEVVSKGRVETVLLGPYITKLAEIIGLEANIIVELLLVMVH